MKGILGFKRGMTRIFDEEGLVVPVTVIEAGPCHVTQIKTPKGDGYEAVQLGFGETKESRLTQAQRGHLRKSKAPMVRHLCEFRGATDGLRVGDKVDVSIFSPGDKVMVSGVSRGLGFAGVIKRHHFNRQPKTHGQSDRERAPGSVGAGTTPGRTFKGKRMAGRMGGERVSVRNLRVVMADPARNLLAIRGAVPGHDGALVEIRVPDSAWKEGE
jgi:large subunit ribosomal protein L3